MLLFFSSKTVVNFFRQALKVTGVEDQIRQYKQIFFDDQPDYKETLTKGAVEDFDDLESMIKDKRRNEDWDDAFVKTILLVPDINPEMIDD